METVWDKIISALDDAGKTITALQTESQALRARNAEFEAEVARLKIEVDVAESMQRHSPAPCGHSSQYCYTEDGGKHIICLLCEVERLRKALEAIKNAYEHRPMVDSNDLYTIAKAALEASDESHTD